MGDVRAAFEGRDAFSRPVRARGHRQQTAGASGELLHMIRHTTLIILRLVRDT